MERKHCLRLAVAPTTIAAEPDWVFDSIETTRKFDVASNKFGNHKASQALLGTTGELWPQIYTARLSGAWTSNGSLMLEQLAKFLIFSKVISVS